MIMGYHGAPLLLWSLIRSLFPPAFFQGAAARAPPALPGAARAGAEGAPRRRCLPRRPTGPCSPPPGRCRGPPRCSGTTTAAAAAAAGDSRPRPGGQRQVGIEMMMQFSPLCFCLFACFLAFFYPSVFLPADFSVFPFLLLHFPSPSSLPLHCKLVQGPSPVVVESCLLPPPPHFPLRRQPFISLAPSLPSSPLSILTANTRGADGGGGREKKLDWFELPLVEEGMGGKASHPASTSLCCVCVLPFPSFFPSPVVKPLMSLPSSLPPTTPSSPFPPRPTKPDPA